MALKDKVSPELLESANRFIDMLKDGTIRKQVIPNTSDEFDAETVLENAKALSKSGFMDRLIKRDMKYQVSAV